jgi:hypothetical protein
MSMLELISVARWDAYREGRHCAKRYGAFLRDAAKAVDDFHWSAKRFPSRGVVVRLYFWLAGDVNKYDGFHPEDGKTEAEQISACIERLTLEALRDVARATKERLDRKPARR